MWKERPRSFRARRKREYRKVVERNEEEREKKKNINAWLVILCSDTFQRTHQSPNVNLARGPDIQPRLIQNQGKDYTERTDYVDRQPRNWKIYENVAGTLRSNHTYRYRNIYRCIDISPWVFIK